MLVEVAKTQDNEVGDGTTTAVVLNWRTFGESREHYWTKMSTPPLSSRGTRKQLIRPRKF